MTQDKAMAEGRTGMQSSRDEYHAANRCVDVAVLHLTGNTKWPEDWMPLPPAPGAASPVPQQAQPVPQGEESEQARDAEGRAE